MTSKDADSRITPDPSRMSVMFWTLTAATNLLTLCKRLDLHFVFSFRFMCRRVLLTA